MSRSPFLELLRARSSVRRYADRPVADADILSLAEAARLSPSAENTQCWRFVVVKDPAVHTRLSRACFSGIFLPTRFAAKAPVIFALCADKGNIVELGKAIKDRRMYRIDCGIAGEHLVLRAAELGLGTCWIGWFDRRRARKVLGVPIHAEVVALIAVGYPVDGARPRRKTRRPLPEMLWLDAWGRGFPGANAQGESEK